MQHCEKVNGMRQNNQQPIVRASGSTWIPTFSGKRIDLAAPNVGDIEIRDIAHGLSHVCRWGGQCREYYSVAQHSVLVSQLVPKSLSLCALLHDATEAYLGDVTRPLRSLLPDYEVLERRMWRCIAACFGLPQELPPIVKEVDNLLLWTEFRDLVYCDSTVQEVFGERCKPLEYHIVPIGAREAQVMFLKRFVELKEEFQ